MRAISTVLDVAVFLLLVSAAVGTVAYAPSSQSAETDVDETADLLATTTATVEYDLAGGYRESHGTLATLLGRAAVTNATLDATELPSRASGYERALSQRVRDVLVAPNRTQVVARWAPYRGAPLSGRYAVGATPPAGVDVSVATLTIPAPVSTVSISGQTAYTYRWLGERLASVVTGTLLPATHFGASLGRENPTAVVSVARYRGFADSLGVTVAGALAAGDVATAHESVMAALADRLAADMASRFDTSGAAADALRPGVVQITVRRWGS
jgi:hypothetical protein